MKEEYCRQCPRACSASRTAEELGYCRAPRAFSVTRIAPHLWEEPCISGTHGSGTVFFSGCNLRCVYCQNRAISRGEAGRVFTHEELKERLLRLQEEGVHNLNFVTPTHYAYALAALLEELRPQLHIPVVYNSGGYESVEALRRLDGLVDIYLPDFKYSDATLAARYSAAPDYPEVATAALREMIRQTDAPVLDEDGMLKKGTVVRHLVLPGHRHESVEVLEHLHKEFGNRAFLLSLMSQYTPEFAMDTPYKNLHRRVTSFEYDTVLEAVDRLGFEGYFQDRSAASGSFTPNFSEDTF